MAATRTQPIKRRRGISRRTRAARALGLVYVGAPAAAEAWLALPHPAEPAVVPMLAACVLAQALGVVLLSGRLDAARGGLLRAFMTLATALVAGLYALSGSASSGFAFLFAWTVPLAFLFSPLMAVIQGAISVLALLLVHLGPDGTGQGLGDVGEWMMPVATIVVVGTIVHRLMGELRVAEGDRVSAERERADNEVRRAGLERERARREEALGRLGRIAVAAPERRMLLDGFLGVLAGSLDPERCEVLELRGDELVVAASTAATPASPGRGDVELARHALGAEEPVVVWEWASERRVDAADLRARGLRSSVAAAVRGGTGALGVVVAHSRAVGAFSTTDARWLGSASDLLASALERQRSEAAIRHQSLHDALTGLPNRALLYDRIEHAFDRAERDGHSVAVLLLDVNGFKTINDSLGHEAGDALLVGFAARLQDVTRGADTVARLGGDEFVVLCDVQSEAEAFAVADRIAGAWSEPLAAGTSEVFVAASVGIAVAARRQTAETMLREADAAMYRAKETRTGRPALFDEAMRRSAFERLRTESELRRAVQRGQFTVHYQPVFRRGRELPLCVEAFARWEHPQRGALRAAEWVRLADETGLVAPIGRMVLRRALGDLAGWRARHPHAADLWLSVNVFGRQVARPEFAAEVRAALAAAGLPPDALGLELTEHVLKQDTAAVEELRGGGVRLLLDDFGTGWSSLARLRRLKVDAIKVDRSFVAGLGAADGDDEEDTAIVHAIVEMGGRLGLEVIAEGVETAQQLERLRALGCESAQGYFLATPGPAGAIDALLAGARGAPERLSA